MTMPKHYEHWTFPEIIEFARLKADNIVKIFNECGEYTEEFKIKNLEFKHFVVINDHLQAIYTGDAISKINGAVWEEDWLNCDMFVWRKENGELMAEFAGTPNHPADDDETFAARHNL